MRNRITTLLLLLCISITFGDAIFLAINDFEGKGITKEESEVITEKIRDIMTRSPYFKVMSRSEMAAIMQEQEFQQTGMCSDASCIAELGQIVGVDKIVAGTIGRVGTLFSVTMKMIDVSTSEVVYSVSHEKKCPIEDLLSVESKVLVQKMETEVINGTRARLWVKTNPEGLKVIINDTIHEISPLKLSELDPGKQVVFIRKETYDDIRDTFNIDPGQIVKKEYTMLHTLAYKHDQRKGKVRKKVTGKIILGLLSVGLGASGFIFDKIVAKDIEAKDSLFEEYSKSNDQDKINKFKDEINEKQNNIDRNIILRNASYGAAIGSGTLFVVSFPLQRRKK